MTWGAPELALMLMISRKISSGVWAARAGELLPDLLKILARSERDCEGEKPTVRFEFGEQGNENELAHLAAAAAVTRRRSLFALE